MINSIPMPAFPRTSGGFSVVFCFILDLDIICRVQECLRMVFYFSLDLDNICRSKSVSICFSASFWSSSSHSSGCKASIHFYKNKTWNLVRQTVSLSDHTLYMLCRDNIIVITFITCMSSSSFFLSFIYSLMLLGVILRYRIFHFVIRNYLVALVMM